MKAMLKRGANLSASLSVKDISGATKTLYSPGEYTSTSVSTFTNALPFYTQFSTTPWTSVTENRLYVKASSDSTISGSAYAPAETIGSCAVSASSGQGGNGWTMTIVVTGSETKTINSLFFSRKLWRAGSGGDYYEACIFALKLDTPVELNAENNYTANFTFAVEF